MRISRDAWSLALAVVTAQRSTCLRRSVGCVLLNAQGQVLATGYNGVPAGWPHCNEPTSGKNDKIPVYEHACAGAAAASGQDLDSCSAIHAEQNALLQCPDVGLIEACYVTTSPCVTCVKLLLNTGCRRIVFVEEYPQPLAKQLWAQAGRSWEQFDDNLLAEVAP